MSEVLDRVAQDLRRLETDTKSDTTEGKLWSLTTSNQLPGLGEANPDWLLPTHHAWGKTDRGDYVTEAQNQILSTITNIIASAETVADVSSLAKVADGGFRKAIIEGARLAYEAGRTPLIRLLWGKTIFKSSFDGDYKSIARLVDDIARVAPGVPVVAALTNFKEIGHEISWNHSKIVAADGRIAMVGGMNLWADDYLQKSAPVTDLSIQVTGDAANAAQSFLDELWQYIEVYGSSKVRPVDFSLTLTPTYVQQANLSGNNYVVEVPPSPITLTAGEESVPILAVGRGAYLRNGRLTRSNERSISKEAYKFSSGWLWDLVSGGGIMNAGDPSWDANNPGDTALRSLIAQADREVVMTQQMLVTKFVDIGKPVFDFRLFQVLAERITSDVDVEIVTSNTNVNGDYKALHPQSSWDALSVLVYLQLQSSPEYLDFTSEEIIDKTRQFMQDNLSIKGLRLSELESWPGEARNPGLHSKIIVIDDETFYVGSQNAYPNQLLEYGFIVDSTTATSDLNRIYLDPLTTYSKEFAIQNDSDFISLLPKTLSMGRGRDSFNGDGENYEIDAGGGDDQLYGGSGRDIMTGGGGADIFIYRETTDSMPARKERDIITDFNPIEDSLDLSEIDWNSSELGSQSALWIGSDKFSSVPGELRFIEKRKGLILQGDSDGDGNPNFEVFLQDNDFSNSSIVALDGIIRQSQSLAMSNI